MSKLSVLMPMSAILMCSHSVLPYEWQIHLCENWKIKDTLEREDVKLQPSIVPILLDKVSENIKSEGIALSWL